MQMTDLERLKREMGATDKMESKGALTETPEQHAARIELAKRRAAHQIQAAYGLAGRKQSAAEAREAERFALEKAGLAAQTQQAATLARLQQAQAESVAAQTASAKAAELSAAREAKRAKRAARFHGITGSLGSGLHGLAYPESNKRPGGSEPESANRGRIPARAAKLKSNYPGYEPLEPFGSTSAKPATDDDPFMQPLEPFGSFASASRKAKRTDSDPFMSPLEPFGSGISGWGRSPNSRRLQR